MSSTGGHLRGCVGMTLQLYGVDLVPVVVDLRHAESDSVWVARSNLGTWNYVSVWFMLCIHYPCLQAFKIAFIADSVFNRQL